MEIKKWEDDVEKKKAYHKIYHKEWYQKNKEEVKQATKKIKQEKKKWWFEYKSTLKCCKCGFSNPFALDFHHRNGLEKDNIIAELVGQNFSREKILLEVDKCDVLCSNCHRILHAEKRGRKDMWE